MNRAVRLSTFLRPVLISGITEKWCGKWRIRNKKNLPSRSYLLNLKPKSKIADGKLSLDVHRVDSNVIDSPPEKKLIQLMTFTGVLTASLWG